MSYLDVEHARALHDRLAARVDAVTVDRVADTPGTTTFVIHHESHTIGNLLRYELTAQRRAVSFVGYSQPHPLEPNIHVTIQMAPAPGAAADAAADAADAAAADRRHADAAQRALRAGVRARHAQLDRLARSVAVAATAAAAADADARRENKMS
jgi:DNA-directed RNA polymerase subunit L